ncbi:MAG: tRNA (N(6)-L-threonylcarbamoyladenosine(37)-C(2))-methylthiotransferase MtaB, partial [Candidatus Desulforudis sp.]|nr:tRNA (N(6)-L-threonylcarbamoyladenosine(37)-C(2))-methylthiotransferase MtaB [Desulforudis sp.]
TDVMVGFPGETAEEFDQSLRFVAEIGFAGLHVFKYSPRKGTPAADYPDQISGDEKENRSRKMIALGKKLKTEFAGRYVEKTVEVLAEETVGEGLWTGYTPNYIRTVGSGQGEYEGKIIKVAVKRVEQGNLKGIIYD